MSRTRRSTALIAAASIGAASLITACSSGGSESGGSDEPLTYQSLAWQPDVVAAQEQAVEDWNAENPDRPVEYLQGDWGNVLDSLTTGFAGGKAPDLIHWEGGPLHDFAARGNLLDIDGLLSDEFVADINESAWSTVQYRDLEGTYGVPFLQETQIIVANKEMLDEAGIEPATIDDPWTWDEFREIAEELTLDTNNDGRPDVYGAGMGLQNPAERILGLAIGLDGQYFEWDGDTARPVFGEGERALPELLHTMLHEDHTLQPSLRGLSGSDVLPSFFQGKTAMVITPIYTRRAVVEGAESVEGGFEWVAIPAPLGVSQMQASAAQAVAINADTSDQDTAVEFLEFLLAPERQVEYALGDWLLPTSRAALESPELSTSENGWDVAMAGADHLDQAMYQTVPGIEEFLSRIAVPALDDYFADKITIDELADRFVNDGAAVLDRYQG